MHDGWELLIDSVRLSERGKRMMKAMAAAAPDGTLVSEDYSGKRPNLMLYGPGSREHLPLVHRTRKRGGRVAMWDLGYWERRDDLPRTNVGKILRRALRDEKPGMTANKG